MLANDATLMPMPMRQILRRMTRAARPIENALARPIMIREAEPTGELALLLAAQRLLAVEAEEQVERLGICAKTTAVLARIWLALIKVFRAPHLVRGTNDRP
jgi:hypothetical protein